jgi:muramoyltetrapeptide carboxypeptidase
MKKQPILLSGDEIRVIAPSQSMSTKKYQRGYDLALERLTALGYKVTFSENVREVIHLGTGSAQSRAQDFNDAYADKNVKLVMALSGGWSANEILPLIDWKTVRANPKPLIGFSDITVLINALYAKNGTINFLGPNYSTLGKMVEWQYTLNHFQSVMTSTNDIPLARSKQWGEFGRARSTTKSWKVLNRGQAEAILIGGNIGTFYLLQGTDYQPSFNEPFIFALEDDDEASRYTANEVSRRFESTLQLPGFRENLRGLIIGRFEKGSNISDKDIESIIESKRLGSIPIASRIDFGHTKPLLTLPIGGAIRLSTLRGVQITII